MFFGQSSSYSGHSFLLRSSLIFTILNLSLMAKEPKHNFKEIIKIIVVVIVGLGLILTYVPLLFPPRL